jgi:hypothetical protein
VVEEAPAAALAEQEEEPQFRILQPTAEDAGLMLVCSAHEQKVNPLELGPVVQAYTGLAHRDAVMQVTRGMGILAEHVEAHRAQDMVAALRRAGVEAFPVPVAAVPGIERELQIARIYGADEGALHVQTDADGTVKALPWEKLVAGMCTQARLEARTVLEEEVRLSSPWGAEGMPGARGTKVYETHRTELEAPIRVAFVLRDDAGKAYLMVVDKGRINYAYLGERRKGATDRNLAEFLGDVLRWCKRGFFPAGFRAAARGQWRRVTQVVGRRDHDSYLRWVICCAYAQGLFAVG